MGYNPKLWGPEGWHFIHYVALNYPERPTQKDKNNYLKFLNSLTETLPCPGCAYNFAEKLKNHPPPLDNRIKFFEWTVDMHNQVNVSNGKPKITYEKALKDLSKKRDNQIIKESFIISASIYILLLNLFLIKK